MILPNPAASQGHVIRAPGLFVTLSGVVRETIAGHTAPIFELPTGRTKRHKGGETVNAKQDAINLSREENLFLRDVRLLTRFLKLPVFILNGFLTWVHKSAVS